LTRECFAASCSASARSFFRAREAGRARRIPAALWAGAEFLSFAFAAVGLFVVLSLRHFGWSFYPLARGTDESGAARFLLDLLGPPDGEVAAGADADFFLAISVCCGDRAAALGRAQVWGRAQRQAVATALIGVCVVCSL
jgi:hypothetical protein